MDLQVVLKLFAEFLKVCFLSDIKIVAIIKFYASMFTHREKRTFMN